MIRLLTDALPEVPEDTPFGCRILSAAMAYGLARPFARFWAQDGGTSVFLLDREAVLLEGSDSDFPELREFLCALGPETLCCPAETAEQLGFPVSARGQVMCLRRETASAAEPQGKSPGPREIWALLKRAESDTFRVPPFEPFYLDLSYRMRHGAAFTSGIFREESLVACAVCTAATENAAVISAVACAPELRRQGLAGAAVRELAARLGRPNLYIFRAEGENEAFYRSLGFQPCGGWCKLTVGG